MWTGKQILINLTQLITQKKKLIRQEKQKLKSMSVDDKACDL